MRATLATLIGCCLLSQACDSARDSENQASEAETTAVEVGLAVESPEAKGEQVTMSQLPETGGEQLTEAERIQRKNEEMLAALAAEEESARVPDTTSTADSDSAADKGADSVSSRRETDSPSVDLSGYEDRLSELVSRHEEFRARLRVATTDCEPKKTTSSGYFRDPYTGQSVSTSESAWTEGSPAACAEVKEINSRISGLLIEYDRLYNEYTLEAMQHGLMLDVKRRQLPIPKRK